MNAIGPPDLTVICVTHNSAHDVAAALGSAVDSSQRADLSTQVIVVDNASSDSSGDIAQRAVPWAEVIRNTENLGFGRANNQAFTRARGRRWLLLNPDARLQPDTVEVLIRAMVDLRAAVVAPSIGASGAESAGMAPGLRSALGHFLFLNRLLPDDVGGPWRGFQLRRRSSLRPRRVDWASAAVLLVDGSAVSSVDGFDPQFFLYGEDVDLGMRLGEIGARTWLVPAARATHRIAGSQGGVSVAWVDALHDLVRRRHGRLTATLFDVILAIGLATRAAVLSTRRGTAQETLHAARMRAASRRAAQLVVRGFRQ